MARGAAAAGLAVLGVFLALSGRDRPAEDACLRMGVCRGCGRAEDCGLPQALSMRQELEAPGRPGAADQSSSSPGESGYQAKGGQPGV